MSPAAATLDIRTDHLPQDSQPARIPPLARVGRSCARHRRAVLAVWLIVLIAGLAAGIQVFSRLKESNGGGTEAAHGSAILNSADPMGMSATVLVQGPSVDAPATRTAVQALTA